jgi:hypothetical protein
MSDFYESAGEDMQQEPPNELDCIQGHLFYLILVPRVSPAKADTPVLQAQNSSVGNRYAMGIPRQVF